MHSLGRFFSGVILVFAVIAHFEFTRFLLSVCFCERHDSSAQTPPLTHPLFTSLSHFHLSLVHTAALMLHVTDLLGN